MRAFSSVSHSSERKNPFNSLNIESERDGPATALSEHSNFRFESSFVPIVCYLREENFASFAISPHAGFLIGERGSTHTQCQLVIALAQRENKSRKKRTRRDIISDCS